MLSNILKIQMEFILEAEINSFSEINTWQKLHFFLKFLNKHLMGNMEIANLGILNARL